MYYIANILTYFDTNDYILKRFIIKTLLSVLGIFKYFKLKKLY